MSDDALVPQEGADVVEADEDSPAAGTRSLLAARRSWFKGPIPPPEAFGQYEQIVPGAGDRILAMAEREQAQRHEFTMKEVTNTGRRDTLGIGALVLITIVVCAAAAFFAYMEQPLFGFLSIGGAIALITGGLLYRIRLHQGEAAAIDRFLSRMSSLSGEPPEQSE